MRRARVSKLNTRVSKTSGSGLKLTRVPVRLVLYPGEGHGNRSNVSRYDYALRTLRWFDHYLKLGDHRHDPLPPKEVDYGSWQETSASKDE